LVDDYFPAKNPDGQPGYKFKATVQQTANFGEYSKNCQMKNRTPIPRDGRNGSQINELQLAFLEKNS